MSVQVNYWLKYSSYCICQIFSRPYLRSRYWYSVYCCVCRRRL